LLREREREDGNDEGGEEGGTGGDSRAARKEIVCGCLREEKRSERNWPRLTAADASSGWWAPRRSSNNAAAGDDRRRPGPEQRFRSGRPAGRLQQPESKSVKT